MVETVTINQLLYLFEIPSLSFGNISEPFQCSPKCVHIKVFLSSVMFKLSRILKTSMPQTTPVFKPWTEVERSCFILSQGFHFFSFAAADGCTTHRGSSVHRIPWTASWSKTFLFSYGRRENIILFYMSVTAFACVLRTTYELGKHLLKLGKYKVEDKPWER